MQNDSKIFRDDGMLDARSFRASLSVWLPTTQAHKGTRVSMRGWHRLARKHFWQI